jgi:hypothetical protein
MNRLEQLQKTLLANISSNADYPNLEFVVLDYNSTDSLASWMSSELQGLMDTGRLTFAKTYTPKTFKRSHSRNMAMRIATGDILVNVDADNYTGFGFAHYVNQEFQRNNNIFIATDHTDRPGKTKDAYGRICTTNRDFHRVGGYDETFDGYGWEDADMCLRLENSGLTQVPINNKEFTRCIVHSNLERIQNEELLNEVTYYFVHFESPVRSKVICLKKDGSALIGGLVPDPDINTFRHIVIEEGGWSAGHWKKEGGSLIINGIEFFFDLATRVAVNTRSSPTIKYLLVSNADLPRVVYEHTVITNYTKYCSHALHKVTTVNYDKPYGTGKIVINNDPLRIILLK